MDADINTDIVDWDYTTYPTKHFGIIWASPPCTEYSRAETIGTRKLDEANEIVERTLDMIRYFEPTYYIIENPQTDLLRNQHVMLDLPYIDIDYCKYGITYRKRIRLWTNITTWTPRALCKKACENMNEQKTKHKWGPVSTWGS